jgi:hypothetical protein
MSRPYRFLGISLCLAGALLSPVFYFIVGSIPLTAVSLSAIMLGFTSVALSNARPYMSPEACQMLLTTGMENTAALLEELGLRNKAVYLPSSSRDGSAQAIIPLSDNDVTTAFKGKLPGRLIVRYGNTPEAMAIAVTTPGSVSIKLLEAKPGNTAADIESSLTYVLTGVLDIADSATVSVSESHVHIEVRGAKMRQENIWYYHCIGSPIASIAAAITSEALGKPVMIKQETSSKGHKVCNIELEVLP